MPRDELFDDAETSIDTSDSSDSDTPQEPDDLDVALYQQRQQSSFSYEPTVQPEPISAPVEDPQQSHQLQLQDETLAPEAISILGPKIMQAGSYESSMAQLKGIYDGHGWEDKQKAADAYAGVADNINKMYQKNPDVKLDSESSVTLSQQMLDKNLDQDAKIGLIENWRTTQKQKLFEGNSDSLVGAKQGEKIIDRYASELRRHVVAGNVGAVPDALARGAEAALSPIVGTADVLLGTDVQGAVREQADKFKNPDRDQDIAGKVGSAVGSVAGFTVSALNPYSALGYLGATLVDQGKQVYDQAYEATGSHDAASSAVLESAPGIALGSFADKLVGGSLGAIAKGEPGLIKALSGITAGSVGAAAQAINTGTSLADVSGDSQVSPTAKDVAEQALIGGALGGLIGGLHSLKDRARARVEATTRPKELSRNDQLSAEIDAIHADMRGEFQEAQGIHTIPDEPTMDSAMGQFVQRPDETPGEVLPQQEQPLEDLGDSTVPRRTPPEPGAAEEALYSQSFSPDANTVEGKALPISNGIPGVFMQELVRHVDGEIGLANMDPRMYGFYDPANHLIRISRNVFKDINQAYSTFAHEIGHMVDYAGRNDEIQNKVKTADPGTEPVLHKLVRMDNLLRSTMNTDAVAQEARQLSSSWRPGWDGSPVPAEWQQSPPPPGTPEGSQHKWLQYRNDPREVQADTFSAIMNDPAMVQSQYPAIWEAFTKGLETQPKVKEFWNAAVAVANSPTRLAEWTNVRREAGRMRQADIAIASAEERIAESKGGWKRDLKGAAKSIRHRLLDKGAVLTDVAKSLPAGSSQREQAYKNSLDFYASMGQGAKVKVLFDGPIGKMIGQDWDALGIPTIKGSSDPLAHWKNYERDNRVLNETSQVMESIKSSPQTYHKAYAQIYDSLEARVGKDFKVNPLTKLGRDVTNYKGIALSDQLAKMHLALPEAQRTELFNKMLKGGNFEAAELLAPDTFNVRRYLGNPTADRLSSESNMAVQKTQIGADGFKKLEEHSKKFHSIVSRPLFKSLQESGLVSDNLMNRMELNKDTWVHFNVLKYFEKNPYFDGVIKGQVGTIGDIGDEVGSTVQKAKAIFALSEYQKGQNAAISTARLAGHTVTPVDQQFELKRNFKIGKKSIFETKEELQKSNPENSYLVEYEKGVPTLYEINSPEYTKLFDKSVLEKTPLIAPVLRYVEGYNKMLLERETKTIASPVFMLRQLFNDRSKEALVARSFEPPGLWFHLNSELRGIDKAGNEGAKLLTEGIFRADTEFLFDNNALAVHYAEEAGGMDLSHSAEDLIYQRMGKRVPGEEKLSTPMKINKAINKAMDKTVVLRKVKEKAEKDEARAKINMFNIGLNIKKMGPYEAAAFAKNQGGTPDPLGGGTEARSMSKLFLFGRAHLNGMRTEYELMRSDPKNYAFQYMYRKGIPRLMLSSALMGPLIGALFGEENEKLSRKFLDKIATFDKDTKMIVPFGFTDGNGKYVGWNVKADEIGPDHKALYGRLPISRELINYDQVFNPAFRALENYAADGTISAKKIGQDVAQSLSTVFGAQIAPGIQGAARTGMLALGYNPYDMFRNKGILTKDVQEAGSTLERSYQYLAWSLYNWAPGIFSYKGDKGASTDITTPFDQMSNIPVAGATLKGFFGNSNYGDYEAGTKAQDKRAEQDAGIRMDMGSSTKQLYNEYVKAQSMVTKLGKNWSQVVTPEEANKVHALNNWHSRAYKYGFNELRSYSESGDAENMKTVRDSLEESSAAYLEMLRR